MTTSFGMSMASSENTRDQWNNPLASGSATSHAAFSGYQYFALHATKVITNFQNATSRELYFLITKESQTMKQCIMIDGVEVQYSIRVYIYYTKL